MAVHPVPTSEKVRAPWERSVRGCGTSVRGGCARVVTEGNDGDEEVGQTQDSSEFLMGCSHDDPFDPEGAVKVLDQNRTQSTKKHKSRKAEGHKTIGIKNIDPALAVYLHVAWLPKKYFCCGCHCKVLNHQYQNLATGM